MSDNRPSPYPAGFAGSDVENRQVLNVAAFSDFHRCDIAAQYRTKPDADAVTQPNLANDRSGGSDERIFAHDWCMRLKGQYKTPTEQTFGKRNSSGILNAHRFFLSLIVRFGVKRFDPIENKPAVDGLFHKIGGQIVIVIGGFETNAGILPR